MLDLQESYDLLLDLSSELGYRMMVTGAEIYRVEESVQRVIQAYGVDSGEVFAIPNCINVSLCDPSGQTSTRIRRIPPHDTDLDLLVAYNELCRQVCQDPPPLPELRQRMEDIRRNRRTYSPSMRLLACFVGAGAYAMFFGGSLRDGLCAGLCGVAIGLCGRWMDWLLTNQFIRTIVSGAVSALCALLLVALGLGESVDFIIIGALMLLVPGLIFTNAIRNIMSGDLISGTNLVVQALLIATAIALGTGFVLSLAASF